MSDTAAGPEIRCEAGQPVKPTRFSWPARPRARLGTSGKGWKAMARAKPLARWTAGWWAGTVVMATSCAFAVSWIVLNPGWHKVAAATLAVLTAAAWVRTYGRDKHFAPWRRKAGRMGG